MTMTDVHGSTNVAAIGYDQQASTLRFEFYTRKGANSVYDFFGVPVEIWHGLLSAHSKGEYLAKYIRGQYPTQKLSS